MGIKMNSSPYDNISNQCIHCAWMTFGGCIHPSEPELQDKNIEECSYYSREER